jgi:hypothetical protein
VRLLSVRISRECLLRAAPFSRAVTEAVDRRIGLYNQRQEEKEQERRAIDDRKEKRVRKRLADKKAKDKRLADREAKAEAKQLEIANKKAAREAKAAIS